MPSGSLSYVSRRSFLQFSAAAAAFQMVTEPMLARAAHRPFTADAVMIDYWVSKCRTTRRPARRRSWA